MTAQGCSFGLLRVRQARYPAAEIAQRTCLGGRRWLPSRWSGQSHPRRRPTQPWRAAVPLLRRARAAAIGTVLLATGCLAIPPLAAADPGQATWAGCVQGGPTLRYLVLFADGTASSDAKAQISTACGATTIYYPQIAVAVATSADPDFGQRM